MSLFNKPGFFLYAPYPNTISLPSSYPSCIKRIQCSLAGKQSASVNNKVSFLADLIPIESGNFFPAIIFASCVNNTGFKFLNDFLNSSNKYLVSSSELSFTKTTSCVVLYSCTKTPGKVLAKLWASSRAQITTEIGCSTWTVFFGFL